MSARANVLRLARRYGARVEAGNEGHAFVVRVEARPGYRWPDGPHELVGSCYLPWKTAAWEDVLERMEEPEPCTVADCEWCEDTRREV